MSRTPNTRWSLTESLSIFNNCIRKVIWQNILTTWRESVQLNISFLKGKTNSYSKWVLGNKCLFRSEANRRDGKMSSLTGRVQLKWRHHTEKTHILLTTEQIRTVTKKHLRGWVVNQNKKLGIGTLDKSNSWWLHSKKILHGLQSLIS